MPSPNKIEAILYKIVTVLPTTFSLDILASWLTYNMYYVKCQMGNLCLLEIEGNYFRDTNREKQGGTKKIILKTSSLVGFVFVKNTNC